MGHSLLDHVHFRSVRPSVSSSVPIPSSALAAWGYNRQPTATHLVDEKNTGDDRPVQPGWALSFEVDDYVSVPGTASVIGSNMSFGGWVQHASSSQNGLVSKGVNSQWGLTYQTNKYTLRIANSDLDYVVDDADEWHHVVATVDGTTAKIFYDGVEVASGTVPTMPAANGDPIQLGKFGSVWNLDGRLKDIGVWLETLTPAQALDLYNGTIPGNPEAFYNIEEGAGTTVYDSSGNGNDGTLIGGPNWVEDGTVAKSRANDVGYSTGWNTDGQDIGVDVQGTVGNTLSFKLVTTDDQGIGLSSNSAIVYLLAWKDGSSDTAINSNSGTVVIKVDDVTFTGTRGDLHDLLSDGQGHAVELSSVDFTNVSWSTFQFGGYPSSPWDLVNTLMYDFVFNGEPIEGPVVFSRDESDTTRDVLGSLLDYSGTVPKHALLKQSWALSFDGVDDYVDCGDDDAFSFGDTASNLPFSACAWIKMDDSNRFRILFKGVSSTPEWLFTTNAENELSFFLYDNSGANRIGKETASVVADEGSWIHVAATYDGGTSSSGVKIYRNGVEFGFTDSSNGTYTAMHATNGPLLIGKFESSTDTFANGDICDSRLYNTELSASDVAKIYNQASDQPLPTVGHWPLAEGSGNTAYNVVANANHGTLNGSPVRTKQDVYHRNITKGFRKSGAIFIPALNSGASAADGNALTNPDEIGTNFAETQKDFQAGQPNAPWLNGKTVPSAYAAGDSVAGTDLNKNVVSSVHENQFYVD